MKPKRSRKPRTATKRRLHRLVSRWSKKQQERAHCIVNDIAEDIDNGEGRRVLRQALAIYADLLCDSNQKLKLKELGEASELCTRLKAVIAANDKTEAQPPGGVPRNRKET